MNMKNLLLLVALPLFVGCFNATEPNNHETKAITVSAGIDTTVPQNAVISLVGTVIHSDFPESQLIYRWRQITGQSQSTIADSTVKISRVAFPTTGSFSFAFTVSAGTQAASDTVHFTITDSLPIQKIIVSAGTDTTVPKNALIYLVGNLLHSDFPDSQLAYHWSQVSGEGQVSIMDATSKISQVTFPATGSFSFAFTASAGTEKSSDTVYLTITDSLPFKVLAPGLNERITIGSSYLIRWQIVTPTKMIIFLTCDKGKTYTPLTELALGLYDTTWQWEVDPTLTPSDGCKIRVADYFNRSEIYTESEYFSLVQ
jgi:hypothetical protein